MDDMRSPFETMNDNQRTENTAEKPKAVDIGTTTRDGIFVWWEVYEDGSRGPDNDDYVVNTSSPDSIRSRIKELLAERGIERK